MFYDDPMNSFLLIVGAIALLAVQNVLLMIKIRRIDKKIEELEKK